MFATAHLTDQVAEARPLRPQGQLALASPLAEGVNLTGIALGLIRLLLLRRARRLRWIRFRSTDLAVFRRVPRACVMAIALEP